MMSGYENAQKGFTDTETAWKVKEPDEAKYNFSDEKGLWQPKPEDILSLFEKLAQGNPLPLKWTCPGRRPPEKNVKLDKNNEDGMDMDDDDSKEEESKAPETSAFDFDEPHIDVNAKLIPKRAPGGLGRTPKTEKRVARMDNIMKSLQKQQLQRAAEREARKTKGSPSGAPPSRSRLLNFGAITSKTVTSAVSITSGSNSSGASSPRYAGSGTVTISSPLQNRGPPFMISTAKNISSQPSATVSSDTKTPEPIGVQAVIVTSATQGSIFESTENKLEQANATKDQTAASISLGDDMPAATIQSNNPSSTSAADINSVINNFTKSKISTPYISPVGSSSSISSNIISNSLTMSLDKNFLQTADSTPADSNQPESVAVKVAVSTPTPTTGITPGVNVISAYDTNPAPFIGQADAAISNINHPDSKTDLSNVAVTEVSGQDHPSESVNVSVNSTNSDVQT